MADERVGIHHSNVIMYVIGLAPWRVEWLKNHRFAVGNGVFDAIRQIMDSSRPRQHYAGGPLTRVTLAVCAVPEALTQPMVTVSPG